MSYERKSVKVEALKLASAVYDTDGGLLADKGEWIVVDGPQQFYMKDTDFQRHFSLETPATKTEIHSYPVYIEREVVRPHWPRPWYEQPYIWTSSATYSAAHDATSDSWLSFDCPKTAIDAGSQ